MKPVFLELAEVLAIHQNQIELYGGRHGIRDISILQSALAMPQAGMRGGYFHEDIIEMASAYLFHIVRDHPFIDGNKRTAVASALIFLELNDIQIAADSRAFETMVRSVAEGICGKAALTEFFRRHAKLKAIRFKR